MIFEVDYIPYHIVEFEINCKQKKNETKHNVGM